MQIRTFSRANLGDAPCVVGGVDPLTGDTIASCGADDNLATSPIACPSGQVATQAQTTSGWTCVSYSLPVVSKVNWLLLAAVLGGLVFVGTRK